MTTVYKFKAYYTDAGVGTVQDPAPTCTVINMADDSKLADAQATTASTNMPGLYSYEYSGADGLDCVAFFATTDTGCDVKQLASYVSDKITLIKDDTAAILADTGTDGVVLKAAGLAADATVEIATTAATFVWEYELLGNVMAGQAGYDLLNVLSHLTDIKGAGWTNETLVKIVSDISAISAGSGATAQEVWEYATRVLTAGTNIDLSALATAANLATLDGKADAILEDTGTTLDTLVKDIPTNAELATALGTADDAVLAAVAAAKVVIDDIHDTDLPAVKAETALIVEDTGTTLPATLATLAGYTDGIAGDVWSHATRTLTNQGVEATYPAEGDPLIIYRDTTVTISLTGLGDSTGDAGTKIFFTAKENLEDADTSSILQLVCTRADPITDPDTDDLLYVNKVAPTAATEGTFVFADHTDGTAVVTVAASAAAYLPIYAATPLYWDVKMVTAAGVSTILATGEMYIYGTPTRTVAVT